MTIRDEAEPYTQMRRVTINVPEGVTPVVRDAARPTPYLLAWVHDPNAKPGMMVDPSLMTMAWNPKRQPSLIEGPMTLDVDPATSLPVTYHSHWHSTHHTCMTRTLWSTSATGALAYPVRCDLIPLNPEGFLDLVTTMWCTKLGRERWERGLSYLMAQILSDDSSFVDVTEDCRRFGPGLSHDTFDRAMGIRYVDILPIPWLDGLASPIPDDPEWTRDTTCEISHYVGQFDDKPFVLRVDGDPDGSLTRAFFVGGELAGRLLVHDPTSIVTVQNLMANVEGTLDSPVFVFPDLNSNSNAGINGRTADVNWVVELSSLTGLLLGG